MGKINVNDKMPANSLHGKRRKKPGYEEITTCVSIYKVV